MEARDKPVSQLNPVSTADEHKLPPRHPEPVACEDSKWCGWTFATWCPNIGARRSAPGIDAGAASLAVHREASRCAIL